MFIEQLKEEDVEKLAKKFYCSLSAFKYQEDNSLYVQFFAGEMGPQPEFWFTDFECRPSAYYSYYKEVMVKHWRKLLFQKFGKEYKKELKTFLHKQLEDLHEKD